MHSFEHFSKRFENRVFSLPSKTWIWDIKATTSDTIRTVAKTFPDSNMISTTNIENSTHENSEQNSSHKIQLRHQHSH